MPRNSTGVYSLPTGYLAVSGQTAKASQHNPPLEDIATALTQSVASDGRTPMTGALTLSGDPTLALHAAPKQYVDALTSSPWTDLASAATTDLSTVTGENIRVTGTVTITSLGTAASGVTKLLRFAASLTITHNATSLICLGGANIITAAGDFAEVRSLGSGNWVMTRYERFSGLGAWTTVASAATVDLGAQTSRNIALSGTTGITSFGSTATPDNVPFNIRSTGAITITHSANLICPGAVNLTLAAGDTFQVVQEATGVWRIIAYSLSALPAISGANLTGISSTGRLLRAPQLLTSGTSYTTPAGCNLIFVEVVGGGGGGGGGSGSSGTGNNGNNGGNSTFTVGGNTLTGNGGWAGTGGSNGSGGRAGNDGNIGVRASGGTGSNSNRTFGYNPFSSGGNGAGGSDIPGSAGQSGSNSGGESGGFGGSGFGAGAGGGAAASGFTTNAGGGGGGAGGKQETFLTVIPSTSYSYSIGAGGVGGGGSSGGAGGAGAQGCIRIWEYAI
jgi:hypothetical protein